MPLPRFPEKDPENHKKTPRPQGSGRFGQQQGVSDDA
jgi:hypothetical protein